MAWQGVAGRGHGLGEPVGWVAAGLGLAGRWAWVRVAGRGARSTGPGSLGKARQGLKTQGTPSTQHCCAPHHLADRTRGGEAVSDLAAFARAGITSLDTADNYGPAEALVGGIVWACMCVCVCFKEHKENIAIRQCMPGCVCVCVCVCFGRNGWAIVLLWSEGLSRHARRVAGGGEWLR